MYVDSLLDLARAFSGDLRDLLPVKLIGWCEPAERLPRFSQSQESMSPRNKRKGMSKNKLWIRISEERMAVEKEKISEK